MQSEHIYILNRTVGNTILMITASYLYSLHNIPYRTQLYETGGGGNGAAGRCGRPGGGKVGSSMVLYISVFYFSHQK